MDLLYFGVPGGNFGDDLNLWIWDDLLPGWRDWSPDTVLVGVGTILKKGFLPVGKHKLVLGSGVGYGSVPDVASSSEEWDIRAVRGPLTAAALDLPSELAIVDAAVMLPTLARFQEIQPSDDILFVPHHASCGLLDWDSVCKKAGVQLLSPVGDPEMIIRKLASAKMVIAESMHAAIIADAFRVPWQAVSIARQFNTFKWRDWGQSLGIEPDFVRFFPVLRTLQRAKLAVTPRKVGGKPAVAAAFAGHEAGEAVLRSRGLNRTLLEASAGHLLRKLTSRGGQLSDVSQLERAQSAFARVLQDIVRDYRP